MQLIQSLILFSYPNLYVTMHGEYVQINVMLILFSMTNNLIRFKAEFDILNSV